MPDIVGLNRIFENKEQAIESFGELGERPLERYEDGKQVLARYYDEDGNVASLIGVYHYKRTEGGVDYGNIEIRDGNINSCDILVDISELVEEIERTWTYVQETQQAIEDLAAQIEICCPSGETPSQDANFLTFKNVGTTEHKLGLFDYGLNNPTVFYSLDDGETFTPWVREPGNMDRSVIVQPGQTVKIYGTNYLSFSSSDQNYSTFNSDGAGADGDYFWECYGNVMTLISSTEPTEVPGDYCFYRLFAQFSSLHLAPEFPATALTDYCYSYAFYNCKMLAEQPALRSTSLAVGCYSHMFDTCSTLVRALDLPATDIAGYCYEGMYYDCPSLTEVMAELPAPEAKIYCYANMFAKCNNLQRTPNLPAKFLAVSCYESMFEECTSLRTYSDLRAEIMEPRCYARMFYGCRRLSDGPELNSAQLATACYMQMFMNCSFSTWRPQEDGGILPALTLVESCYEEMFRNCPLKIAPTTKPKIAAKRCCYGMLWGAGGGNQQNHIILGQITVAYESCFQNMFRDTGTVNIESLQNIGTLAPYCFAGMYAGCTSIVRIDTSLPATTLYEGCYSEMFAGCRNIRDMGDLNELPAETAVRGCYSGMFQGCNQIPYGPDIKAQYTEPNCFDKMFYECLMLNRISCLVTDTVDNRCNSWTYECGGTSGTFFKAAGFNGWPLDSENGIPAGWTVQDVQI